MKTDNVREIEDEDMIRGRMVESKKSTLTQYCDLVIGEGSFLKLLKYELITTFLGPIPGALGLFLRKLGYPCLFKKIGKGVVFGRNVVIRHADKIQLGNNVVLDDYCLVDARGAGSEGIVMGDHVLINRGAMIQAKVGPISIGAGSSVGARSCVISQGNGVTLGEQVRIAGGCYISGGNFKFVHGDTIEMKRITRGPIRIDKKSRLAMGSMVLDGVHIEEGCLIGAGSVVVRNIPQYCVAAGVPAKVLRTEKDRIHESSE